jgi:hypothetical protein
VFVCRQKYQSISQPYLYWEINPSFGAGFAKFQHRSAMHAWIAGAPHDWDYTVELFGLARYIGGSSEVSAFRAKLPKNKRYGPLALHA